MLRPLRRHVELSHLRQPRGGRYFHDGASQLGKGISQGKRQYVDDIWIPIAPLGKQNPSAVDAGQLLVKAGFVHQAYSGIFQLLPLGLRVQTKLEALIDKHMSSLHASKVSLSSLTSQKLWDRTGRLHKGSEFFKFKDRKDTDWLLAPTHEEEITSLVKNIVHHPSDLPLRLYQITRKYRDEKRPRGGLLRGKEFLMKDLYTFDKDEASALETYNDVRQAYRSFLDELKLPYVEAKADSGNMGGNLSHEFHFPSELGEDDVLTCTNCKVARNEEQVTQLKASVVLPEQYANPASDTEMGEGSLQFGAEKTFISNDRKVLVKVRAYATNSEGFQIDPFAVKAALSPYTDIDTGVEQPEQVFEATTGPESDRKIYYLFDHGFTPAQIGAFAHTLIHNPHDIEPTVLQIQEAESVPLSPGTSSYFQRQNDGDACPSCHAGVLSRNKAIEIGHTFHLGTRYSSKLDLVVPGTSQHVIMGCHGIGVSRMIAAVASMLADKKGLHWPAAIAPFQCILVVDKTGVDPEMVNQLYDALAGVDVLIDDRKNASLGWKMKDADLIGYPVMVVMGKRFLSSGHVEVQVNRLNFKEDVPLESAPAKIRELLTKL